MQERDWLIALSSLNKVGWITVQRVLESVPSLRELADCSGEWLAQQCGLSLAQGQRIAQEMKPEKAVRRLEELQNQGFEWVTCLDESYPTLLRQIAKPPWVLYYKGNLALTRLPTLAVVGTRRPSSYGQLVTDKLSRDLVKAGWCVVSGMAAGIDTRAHQGALAVNGATIAVLGTGINTIYPSGNHRLYKDLVERGLVLSELPGQTAVHPGMFPQRNRIISGLSRGAVVVEAGEKSGSLITADFALEEGREVFAVPGPITSPLSRGAHRLLKQGAKLLTQVEDVFEEFPWLPHRPFSSTSEEESYLNKQEEVVLELIGYTQIHIDQLTVDSRMELSELYPVLLQLQLKKRVRQLPGAFFVRV